MHAHRSRRPCVVPAAPLPSRRRFLAQSALGAAACLLPVPARAGRLHEATGGVTINGRLASRANEVKALDVIRTGTGGRVVLIMGKDAFLIRAGSEVEILGKPGAAVLTGLRMFTGALLGVFARGAPRQVLTATATAGIRGTGIYVEASPEKTYFCTCYGTVDLADQHRTEQRLVVSGYHAPNIIYATPEDGRMMRKAELVNHTDDELAMLEALVGRKPPFVKP
ncbi:MAG TPA: iron dicitrate transport regulator FecR [Burkholderiales bacterium]|nr:iron dicitrate transport regulator FecR [Burkholderiales bacterium]